MIQIRTNQTIASVRKVFGIALSFIMISPVLNAQGTAAVTPDSVDKFFPRESIIAGKQKSKPQTVDLNIKDSSLSYILRRISTVSGKQIVFSTSLQQLSKHTSVRFKDMPVLDAVNAVLKGSGLTAAVSGDGNTIVVRGTAPIRDTAENNGKGTIEGKVLDSASGKAVHGATISIPGSSASVISKADGSFRLSNLSDGSYQMTVKLLGYKSQQLSIKIANGQTQSLTVRISPSATSLNEVVTTATGQQRRVETSNDIVKIDAEKIRQRAPVRSLIDMIEAAQVPGVVVTRASGDPGAATRVRIRGIGSISQSNDPVYILDGMWISQAQADQLDQEIIEKVEIAKGPSAATLYGQNAANGVIVITTRKGIPGTTRWNLNYSKNWGQSYGRMPLFYEGLGYSQITGARVRCPIKAILELLCVQDSVAIYDPNDRLILREGQGQNNVYSLSLDGGSNSVKYALTASRNDELGVRRAAPVDLIRLRKLNLKYDREMLKPSRLKEHKLTSILSFYPRENLDITLSVIASSSDLVDNRYSLVTLYDPGLEDKFGIDTTLFLSDSVSRAFSQMGKVKGTKTTSFGSTVTWRYKYGIVINTSGGISQTSVTESGFTDKDHCWLGVCRDTLGMRNEGTGGNTMTSLKTSISVPITKGRFANFLELNPIIGLDFQRNKTDNFSVQKDSVPGGESSIESGKVISTLGRRNENALAGWHISSKVGILKKLYFNLGIRQDIGSAITSSSNTTYPKIGGSWVVSNEGFWKENKIVNMFRVRSSIGYAAVQPDVADVKGNYVIGSRFVDGKIVRSLELNGVGNSQLVPERSVELELGFDMDMISERVNIVATYSHKENKNTLVTMQLPSSFGLEGSLQRKENIGRVQNKNLELTVKTVALDKDWLRILVDYGHTVSDNRVKSLGPGIVSFEEQSPVGSSPFYNDFVAVGYPLGGTWRKTMMGYFDENGDGILGRNEMIEMDALSYVGSSNPRYNGSYGFNAMIIGKLIVDSRFSYQSKYVPNYIGQDKNDVGQQDARAPLAVQAYAAKMLGMTPISSFRWNTASISYSFSPKKISFLNTRSLTASLQASNIGLWTKFVGRDPWVNTGITAGSEMLTVDYGATPPQPRKFAFNIRMGL